MSPRYRRKENRSDETRELTGSDATPDEAQFGNAGDGADPFEADLSGTTRQSRSIEDEGEGEDIGPDRIDRFEQAEAEEAEGEEGEREITARPSERSEPDFSSLP